MTVRSRDRRGWPTQEDLNFLLTNRIPRPALTRFMGWFSRIEQPLVRDFRSRCGGCSADVDLHEAQEEPVSRACTTASSASCSEGARPIDADPDVLVSPCDAIVGACGRDRGNALLQVKGFPYTLEELLGDAELPRAIATDATRRCASRPACITASTRRTTAASSRSPTSRATPGT